MQSATVVVVLLYNHVVVHSDMGASFVGTMMTVECFVSQGLCIPGGVSLLTCTGGSVFPHPEGCGLSVCGAAFAVATRLVLCPPAQYLGGVVGPHEVCPQGPIAHFGRGMSLRPKCAPRVMTLSIYL